MISWITHEKGELNFGDRFISIKFIKEMLEKGNKILILEETEFLLKCRVFRIIRVFGGPWIGPQPVLYFRIEQKQEKTILYYDFYWLEYYMVAFCSAVFGFAIGYFEHSNLILRINAGLIAFLFCILFTGSGIFIDTKYYSKRLRKELLRSFG